MKDQLIDGYRLVRLIGAGGFGEVWLCDSILMPGLWKAFKWIPAHHSGRLERELEALIHYQRAVHKVGSANLMRIEHVNRTSEGLFYVMPLADSIADEAPEAISWRPATLSNLIQKRKDAPEWFTSREVISIMAGVLNGLQDLSELGLVHRDLKPENILFLNRAPVIADISLVGQDCEDQTNRGTPGYIAPSWYLEGGGHPDQYAAGATLFALLTGNSPDKMGRSAFRWPPGGEKALSKHERSEWFRLHKIIYRATHETHSERFRDFAAMRSLLTGSEIRSKKKRLFAYCLLILVSFSSAWGLFTRHPNTENQEVIEHRPTIDAAPVEEIFEKAMSYYTGNDQAVDLGLAARLFADGAGQGHAKSQNMFGFLHIFRNDAFEPEKAFPWFQKAADQGDAAGQFNLACCYYWGVGTTRDDTHAVQWLRRSSQQGFAPAQAALGFALYTEIPPTEDLTEAMDLLKKAAASENVEAMKVLGIALETGDGLPQDIAAARIWNEKVHALRERSESSHLAVWTDQNGKTAWRGANYVMVQRLNANTQSYQLFEFDGVPVTRTEGDSGPSFRIHSENPELTEKRIIKAIEANLEGARHRNREAELWIGRAYMEGRFLPWSKQMALPWLRRAAVQGDEEALKLIQEALKTL